MDFEKKYKDALEWISSVYLTFPGATKEYAKHYFPELCEIEDERMRNEIIGGLMWQRDSSLKGSDGNDCVLPGFNLPVNILIAWLEKQKDSPMPEYTVIFQKGVEEGRRLEREDLPYWQTFKGIGIIVPDDYILAKFGKGYKLLRPGDTMEIGTEFLQVSQLDNLPKEEQHKEQKPMEPSYDELQRHQNELYDFKVFATKQAKEHHISFVHDFEWNNFCAELLSYFAEQKQEWGEEDEKMLAGTLNSLKRYQLSMPNYQVELQMRWLKSIRPQPKQEWSDEDEKILVTISKALGCDTAEKILVNEGVTLVMAAGFLESLKNRGNSPKSNTNSPWKPSEEQMRCLQSVVQDVNKKSLMSTTGYSPAAVLQSLYIDLKALM